MYLARPTRFERVTAWFVARYSIQLSYGRVEGAYYREEGVLSQGLMADRQLRAAGGFAGEISATFAGIYRSLA